MQGIVIDGGQLLRIGRVVVDVQVTDIEHVLGRIRRVVRDARGDGPQRQRAGCRSETRRAADRQDDGSGTGPSNTGLPSPALDVGIDAKPEISSSVGS